MGVGPSAAWVRGTWGWGAWVRLREREARQAGRERQRQAGSQPALYPCRIDPPCHSPVDRQQRKRERGGEVWGRAAGPL